MADPTLPLRPSERHLSTAQLQRVYLILTVRALWPTISPAQAVTVAAYLEGGAG